jgi:hypothetical protein
MPTRSFGSRNGCGQSMTSSQTVASARRTSSMMVRRSTASKSFCDTWRIMSSTHACKRISPPPTCSIKPPNRCPATRSTTQRALASSPQTEFASSQVDVSNSRGELQRDAQTSCGVASMSTLVAIFFFVESPPRDALSFTQSSVVSRQSSSSRLLLLLMATHTHEMLLLALNHKIISI